MFSVLVGIISVLLEWMLFLSMQELYEVGNSVTSILQMMEQNVSCECPRWICDQKSLSAALGIDHQTPVCPLVPPFLPLFLPLHLSPSCHKPVAELSFPVGPLI